MSSVEFVTGTYVEYHIPDIVRYVNEKHSKKFIDKQTAMEYLFENDNDILYVNEKYYKITIIHRETDDWFGTHIAPPLDPSSGEKFFVTTFYNGGACLHEVLEDWIRENE